MTEPVFLIAFGMAAITVIMAARAIASAISGHGASRPELTDIRDQLDRQAAALEDAQNSLASQATQVAELHERLDFAERLLAQTRERTALPPGDKHG